MFVKKFYMALNQDTLEKSANVLKTIAHPTRLAIVHLLELSEKLTVNDICLLTGCEQSLISHHLSGMKLRGILQSRKSGQNVYYSLRERNLIPVVKAVQLCECTV